MYRLARISNDTPGEASKIEMLDHLTKEQFKKCEESIATIEELNHIIRLLDFAEINEKDLRNFFQSAFENLLFKSTSWNGIKRNDSAEVFLNGNRLFLNYISSIRIFIDHSEVFFNRKYGNKSPQFLEFKKILSIFYDNSFAYRFFYKLRNYALHVGLPIHSMQFSSKHDRENGKIHGELEVMFDRDKLLSNFDGWGVVVKEDLQKKGNRFEIMPLVSEISQNIREIERNVELLHKEELIAATNFITDLTQHQQKEGHELVIAYNFTETEEGIPVSHQSLLIPFETIELINNKLLSNNLS